MSLIDRYNRRVLCVALAPEQLTAVLRSGGRIVAGSEVCIALTPTHGHWQSALDALQAWLQQDAQGLRGVPIAVSLASRWCQMTMLPWSDALLDPVGAQHFTQAQFGAIFGELARSWVITTDDAPYGQPRLACAIERALLTALQDCAAANGHTCVSVEALLPIAARALAGAKPAAIAVIEPGRMLFAALTKGRIVALQTQPCSTAWAEELAPAWQRWSLRAPELAGIASVAVANLLGKSAGAELPARFQATPLPNHGLAPAYATACMTGR